MTIDKSLKKRVADDWQEAFPNLRLFSPNKLYKIIGPIVIGIELTKLPRSEEYRPHFVIYSLCGNKDGNDIKACMSYPILMQQLNHKKGLQMDIAYIRHAQMFPESIELIKKQIPLPFDNDISLSRLFAVIENYAKSSPMLSSPNSYLVGRLEEAKFQIALFLDQHWAIKMLDQIKTKTWDKKSFEMWNVNINTWFHELNEKLVSRDEFLMRVNSIRDDPKMSKLERSIIMI